MIHTALRLRQGSELIFAVRASSCSEMASNTVPSHGNEGDKGGVEGDGGGGDGDGGDGDGDGGLGGGGLGDGGGGDGDGGVDGGGLGEGGGDEGGGKGGCAARVNGPCSVSLRVDSWLERSPCLLKKNVLLPRIQAQLGSRHLKRSYRPLPQRH